MNISLGHVEVYNFEYTGGAQFFEAAVRYFFQFHDPTVLNRQGNDRVIVCHCFAEKLCVYIFNMCVCMCMCMCVFRVRNMPV